MKHTRARAVTDAPFAMVATHARADDATAEGGEKGSNDGTEPATAMTARPRRP